jgi:predicted phosphodiesterase
LAPSGWTFRLREMCSRLGQRQGKLRPSMSLRSLARMCRLTLPAVCACACIPRPPDPAPGAAERGPTPSAPASATAKRGRPPEPATVEVAGARTVAIYGDSRTRHDVHRRVVAAIGRIKPDVVFHTGDLVNDGRSAEDWRVFDDITRDLRQSARFFPVLGNHERKARGYFDRFELPGNKRWYEVDTPMARFVLLDSGTHFAPDSPQRRWLENALAERRSTPVIALLHAGMFSSGPHGGDPNLVRDLLPVLERGHVAAVFAGHDHDYERSVHGGIVHVVTGGGGGPLYDRKSKTPDSVKFVKAHHFCKLTASGPKVHVEVLTPNLELLDEFEVGE